MPPPGAVRYCTDAVVDFLSLSLEMILPSQVTLAANLLSATSHHYGVRLYALVDLGLLLQFPCTHAGCPWFLCNKHTINDPFEPRKSNRDSGLRNERHQ